MSELDSNSVILKGKVSQKGRLNYTPTGNALCEFILAAPQLYFGERSMGYFSVLLTGELAEAWAKQLRVGTSLEVKGTLWSRQYKDKKSRLIKETLVIAKDLV